MSEEQNQNEAKHNCSCKKIAFIAFLSLILSIASLAVSSYLYANVTIEKKVVISTQYDKGQSLEKAQKTEKPIIVFFYTDWCGFCQRFIPTYSKLAKDSAIKKNFAIAYVNCEDSNNAKTVQDFKVQGFPTVYVIDKKGNRTQLDNNTFFNDDSVEVLKNKALELIK